MPILNYTTSIKVEKTVGEIQLMLAQSGALSVLCEYDPEGVMAAMSFKLSTPYGILAFRLPSRVDAVLMRLEDDPYVMKKFKTREQAARVAWRITKNWIEVQLAFVESGQAEMEEILLPFMQDPSTGQTVYQKLAFSDFNLLTVDK